MGLFDTIAGNPTPSGSIVHLEGKEQVGVIGAADHQEAAERVVERNPEENLRVSFTATLVPKPATLTIPTR